MRALVLVAIAACGSGGRETVDGATTDGPSPPDGAADAAVVTDAGPFPTSWTVTLVEPPAGDASILPMGMDATTGEVVGYAGPGQWDPQSRPVRVTVDGVVSVLDVDDADYGFGWGASSTMTTGEYDWQPQVWAGTARTPLPVPPGWFSGSAHAADETGLIVGSWADYDDALPPNPVGPRPCAWRDGVLTQLQILDVNYPIGAAWAVDATGGITGALSSPSAYLAVRWATPTSAPVVVGPIPGAFLTEARAINARGDVAGRASLTAGPVHAFVAYGTDQPILLPFPAGSTGYAEAYDLDDAGRVVGAANAGPGVAHAVAWVDGAIVDLDAAVTLPPGASHLSSAVGIDNHNRIAAEVVMAGETYATRLAILEPVVTD